MHFHASFRECNSSIRGSPRGATLQDLLANGARHVVVPRYVQTERATQLAEFAVVFRLTELRDAPPGVRGARYACQHEVGGPRGKFTRYGSGRESGMGYQFGLL